VDNSLILAFSLFLLMLQSCREKRESEELSPDSLSGIIADEYKIDLASLQSLLRQYVSRDTDRSAADIYVKKYYLNEGRLLWLTRGGVSSKADSVLKYIMQVELFGFDADKFSYSLISTDLRRARCLDFDNGHNSITRVYSRLEYFLSKAYMRYCAGQRYGFTNPDLLFNRLEKDDSDTSKIIYKRLFDIPVHRPGNKFYASAIDKILEDSVGAFMAQSVPISKLYKRLAGLYSNDMPEAEKACLLCNMERSRWNMDDRPELHDKYVMVNIPAQSLMAVDNGETLTMRIGCGAPATKTPLLTSRIKRLDFNPKWIIPKS